MRENVRENVKYQNRLLAHFQHRAKRSSARPLALAPPVQNADDEERLFQTLLIDPRAKHLKNLSLVLAWALVHLPRLCSSVSQPRAMPARGRTRTTTTPRQPAARGRRRSGAQEGGSRRFFGAHGRSTHSTETQVEYKIVPE